MNVAQVIVIGAGPAGLMAAIQSAKSGSQTLLLEKTAHPAAKLLLTGSTRCNLTNALSLPQFIKHFRPDGRFLRQCFNRFFRPQLCEFFEQLGVPTYAQPDGCIFPASNRAADVANALLNEAAMLNVRLKTNSPVRRLLVEAGRITAVRTAAGQTFAADAVILATGGASYPSTGSTGDGFALAQSVGHTITPIRPALVGLETAGQTAQNLQGLALDDAAIRVQSLGKKEIRSRGQILFTHFGLSGPAVLSLSGYVVDLLAARCKVTITLDLLPAVDTTGLETIFTRDFAAGGKRQIATCLKNLLPARLALACAQTAAVPPETLASQLTTPQRKAIISCLKNFQLQIIGHRPIEEAIVTAGGVALHQIDPRTLASRLVKGLYFAGEVIDIDGNTGGFNLQAAFSTGFLAGANAAEFVRK